MTRLPCPPDDRMEPLFGPVTQVAREGRPKALKPRAWGQCPQCRSADRHALVLQGRHLVWRGHTYRTWSGAYMQCTASWVRLCDAHPRPGTVVTDAGKTEPRTQCTCLAAL